MRLNYQRAQTILEYVVLFCVILVALLIMQFYIKRGYQGRIKQEVDEVGQQYSPGHTTSNITTNTNTTSTTCTGGTCKGVELQPGETVTISNTTTTSERKEAVGSFATEK